ncbi:MAG: alpha-glucan family phosphorylase [Roseibacillus sp.]
MKDDPEIAYFSMEIALQSKLPTYAGGLGILAGDTLRSAADMEVPMCAVTLLHRKGYLRQELDASGWQFEHECPWSVEGALEEMSPRVRLSLDGRELEVRCWRYFIVGITGHQLPVYLLDVDLNENEERDRHFTDRLYLGDHYHRIIQEAILGIGGVRMLTALGYDSIRRYHMNEGHAALLGLELLEEEMMKQGGEELSDSVLSAVRRKCVFTTHTPVAAGHDQFSLGLMKQILGDRVLFRQGQHLFRPKAHEENQFNMTYLALNVSRYVNGVAKRHAEISRIMFAEYEIDAITNGVHAGTWVTSSFAELFDRYLPKWREDNFLFRSVLKIPREEIWDAHLDCKKALFARVQAEAGVSFDPELLTLGFARRATAYKRPELLFENEDWLFDIAREAGGLQIIFAGKAHPGDDQGKFHIQHIVQSRERMAAHGVHLVFLTNYDMALGKLMTSGVDLWLNTPQPPLEASGTSGMKAALNGVPSLSILDGWWHEGCLEDVTGWAICSEASGQDARSLYEKLERRIVPMYRDRRSDFIDVMRQAIALNGSYFNTERMVLQYVERAYFSR